MIDPNPRLSPGRVFPVQVDDVMVEAQIIATYDNEARVVVYGPGASGHVHAKTIPLEEIP